MWLRRTRSKIPRNHASHFSCSSFKDIQSLCASDDVSDCNSQQPGSSSSSSNSLKRSSSIFQRVYLAKSVLRALSSPDPKPDNVPLPPPPSLPPPISLPGSEKRVVVYFTSLRVVRSTFEDCNAVRFIFSGLRVLVDERDVTMDSRFMDELCKLFGQQEKSKLTLPRVFIDGRYIGGADEIRRLNETGELKKHVEGLTPAGLGTCQVCGGYRFILCDECSGSHKCYSEKGGFRSCTSCNENGLIRCPSCSSAPF